MIPGCCCAIRNNGERNRTWYVLKSRGMAQLQTVREFVLRDDGIVVGRDRGPNLTASPTARQVELARNDTQTRARRRQQRRDAAAPTNRAEETVTAKPTDAQDTAPAKAEWQWRLYVAPTKRRSR